MKRVLFYESRPEWGGAQKCELDLIIGLGNGEDFQTYFLTSTTGPMVDRAVGKGVVPTVIPIHNSVDRIRKEHVKNGISFAVKQLFYMFPHLWKLFLYITRNHIDLVYTSQMRSQIVIGWLARLAGKKVIWHIHGQEKLDNFLGKICLKSSSKVIVVSKEIVSTYQNLFPQYSGKFECVHNGIDLQPVSGRRKDSGGPRKGLPSFSMVMVGSLIKGKRQDLAIKAVARLKESSLVVQLNIVGEKPEWHSDKYKESLFELVKMLGISDQVHFWGWLEKPQTVLAESDLFVLPSDTEGLPLSIIEAMAFGLPVIATNVGGIPELVEHNINGILIEQDSDDELVEAIIQFAMDPILLSKMGQNSQERYQKYFTRKVFLEGVAGVINTI